MKSQARAIVHVTYGKTELFLKSLEAAGIAEAHVFVICTQPNETNPVMQMTTAGRRIFSAEPPDGTATPWFGIRASDLVEGLAEEVGLTPLDLILADRHLRRHPADSAMHWLNKTAELYSRLVQQWQPTVLIGEVASASEVLLAALGSRHGIPYLQPATLRIPAARFGLWLGPHAQQLWVRPGNISKSEDDTQELANWLSQPTPPFYVATNNQAPTFDVDTAIRAAVSMARRHSSTTRFAMQYPRLRDYWTLPWLNRFTKARYARKTAHIEWSAMPRPPFVFYPLHVQPEASIDFYPSIWRDQLHNVRAFRDALHELGVSLVVKDHSNFLWSRGKVFHRELLSIEDVHVVDPATPSKALVSSALATVTISGTVALEAGLMGKRAFIVGKHPWHQLPTVELLDTPDQLPALISEAPTAPDPDSVERWYTNYRRNSWPGIVADRFAYPSVLADANIAQLGGAFREFFEALQSGAEPVTL